MLNKLSKQNAAQKAANEGYTTSPYREGKSCSPLLKRLTKHAVRLYEKRTDIKKFTKLVLSNPENSDCNERTEKVLAQEYDDLFNLADNERLLKDLGL